MKFMTFMGTLAAGLMIAVLLAGVNDRFGLQDRVFGPRPAYANWPTPAERPQAPLGTPPEVPDPDGSYTFLRGTSADPVTYDPCKQISYVVRPDNTPRGSEGLIGEAIREVSAATGLQFVYEGTTDEGPGSGDRQGLQPDRYGDRWAPVAISWSTPAETPELEGAVAGVGGSMAVNIGDGPETYVSGRLVLDGPEIARVLDGPDGRAMARAIILHELGHVVGLGHVKDADQLMSTHLRPGVTEFRQGDLTGLARLGAGRCIPGI